MLDAVDKKLLLEIDFDARKSYASLARSLRMSKRGVEYKLRALERDGIITGYTPIIDLAKLGYKYFRVFIQLHSISNELKEAIERYVLQERAIGWVLWYQGTYAIGVALWVRSVTEFKESINRFYLKFGSNIKSKTESLGAEILCYKNRYLLRGRDTESRVIAECETPQELHEVDILLLKALVKSPRAKIVELAADIGESARRTASRLRALQHKRILLGVRPNLNHQLLGKTYYKVFVDLNNLQEQTLRALGREIAADHRTIYIVKALSPHDMDIELMVDSADDLFQFIDRLHQRFPSIIKDYHAMIMTRTVKARFLPLDL